MPYRSAKSFSFLVASQKFQIWILLLLWLCSMQKFYCNFLKIDLEWNKSLKFNYLTILLFFIRHKTTAMNTFFLFGKKWVHVTNTCCLSHKWKTRMLADYMTIEFMHDMKVYKINFQRIFFEEGEVQQQFYSSSIILEIIPKTTSSTSYPHFLTLLT